MWCDVRDLCEWMRVRRGKCRDLTWFNEGGSWDSERTDDARG